MRTATSTTKPVTRVEPAVADPVAPILPKASRRGWWMAVLLILASLLAFWPVRENGFVDMDDEDGFVKNPHLLEPAGDLIRWAWSSDLQGVYQPLARMMYGLEASFWGVNPEGFHSASLALHAINTVVLFAMTLALIRRGRPTLAVDRPGLVMAMAAVSVCLFVIHPLRAEVVAWASVQAYEPAILFAMLSVLAYLQSADTTRLRRLAWLAGSVVLFAISLGFYAITLCLPLALLVLDVYPLRRLTPEHWSRRRLAVVILEKSPYYALSLVFAVLTLRARLAMGTVTSLEQDGLLVRVASTAYGVCFTLVKTLLPTGLGPVHPIPDHVGLSDPACLLSLLAFVVISVAAFCGRRRWPALAPSWLAFLLLQLPTSGLVRFNSTIAADRYSYVTMLGLPALLTGGLCMFLGRRPGPRTSATVGMVGALVAVVLVGMSRVECLNWRDSVAIWSHVGASHGRPEGFFESRIGRALADRGQLDEAKIHLEAAVRLSPGLGYAWNKLGLVLVQEGKIAEAYQDFAEAVRLEPNHVESRINLGFSLVQLGRFQDAKEQLAQAVRLQPDLPEARANLGAVLVHLGQPAEAEVHLIEAIRLSPDRPGGRMDLGYALAQQRKYGEAAEVYADQVRRYPDDRNARHNLGYALDQLGRHDEARAQYAAAVQLNAVNPSAPIR